MTIKTVFLAFIVIFGLFMAGAISLFLFQDNSVDRNISDSRGYDAPWVFPSRASDNQDRR